MSENLTSYRKAIKLSCSTVEESLPTRMGLDQQVEEAVASLSAVEPQLRVTRSTDERGNPAIQISAEGFDFAIATRSGQDTVFQGGERRTFISYTVSASSSLTALDRATSISREALFFLRGIGAILFAGLFFWGINFLLSLVGMIIVRMPAAPIVVLVGIGAWVGERVGASVGARLEARAFSQAERSGSLPQLENLWTQLEQRFNAILQPFEKV